MGIFSRVRTTHLIGMLAVIALGALALYAASAHADRTQSSNVVTIKWLISHQPTTVFANATKVFGAELSKDTNGRLALEVVTPGQVGVTKGDIPNDRVLQLLDSGDVQLATTYTVALGSSDPALWAINLPFAFSSYDQLPAALDGTVGQQLLHTISAHTNDEGLAFTMSGGFRIIASKSAKIESPADMKGLRIGTSGGPVAEATLTALGATPVPLDLESGAVDPSTLDGVETTYTRLSEVVGRHRDFTQYINETNHSLFLTVILANKSFMSTLSSTDQAAVRAAALAAAQVERQDSIALGAQTKARLRADGSVITELSPIQKAAFSEATKSVYDLSASIVGTTSVDAFRPTPKE